MDASEKKLAQARRRKAKSAKIACTPKVTSVAHKLEKDNAAARMLRHRLTQRVLHSLDAGGLAALLRRPGAVEKFTEHRLGPTKESMNIGWDDELAATFPELLAEQERLEQAKADEAAQAFAAVSELATFCMENKNPVELQANGRYHYCTPAATGTGHVVRVRRFIIDVEPTATTKTKLNASITGGVDDVMQFKLKRSLSTVTATFNPGRAHNQQAVWNMAGNLAYMSAFSLLQRRLPKQLAAAVLLFLLA